MESQTSARGDLMQEDPIKEIAVQQLLSYPAHPSLGTPEFVLRDALNLYIVMPFRGVESYQVLTEPTYTPASHFSEPVARHCFRQLIGGASPALLSPLGAASPTRALLHALDPTSPQPHARARRGSPGRVPGERADRHGDHGAQRHAHARPCMEPRPTLLPSYRFLSSTAR